MMVLPILQVLEKDLAIFGFFIALGRSTKSFLASNGFSIVDDHIESFIRCAYSSSFFLKNLFQMQLLVLPLKFHNAALCFVKMCVFQVPYNRKCVILSSTVICQFLSTVCGGQHVNKDSLILVVDYLITPNEFEFIGCMRGVGLATFLSK